MNKQTRNLLIIFIILAAIVYFFFSKKETIKSDKDSPPEKLFTADSGKIDKIEIVKTGEAITLEKINGQWMITKPLNYQADTNAVEPILHDLSKFKITSVTSTNPEHFGEFLDSANHSMITVYQEGKMLGTFELGKYAANYSNSYIKKTDENRILLAENLANSNFVKSLKEFRYKVIFSIHSIPSSDTINASMQ